MTKQNKIHFSLSFLPLLLALQVANSGTKVPELKIDLRKIESCFEKEQSEKCLRSNFSTGTDIQVTKEKDLFKISLKNFSATNLEVSAVRFAHLKDPVIWLNLTKKTFRITGSNSGHYVFKNMTFAGGTTTCEFPINGEFKLSLDKEFSFIKSTTPMEISFPRCLEDNIISGSSIKILKDTEICGSVFPRDTAFGTAESGLEFMPPKNVRIKGSSKISFRSGQTYFNQDPSQDPCKWELKPEPETED